MPSAARLVAALCLALVAVAVSLQIIPLFPDGKDFGNFIWVNAAIGLLTGWLVMDKRAGGGATAAINNGLTGVVALLFWALAVHATAEMVKQAMRNRFGGPFEALLSVFDITYGFGTTIMTLGIALTLLIGAVVSGLATEYAGRRWR